MTAEPVSPVPAPPTERLYWAQPEARSFTAQVTAVRGQEVALDRTLFYPEGGGQPCDAGTLAWEGGEAGVTDVQKEGSTVWHRLEGAAPAPGTEVTGTLDWTRRYRHSQRHTAEHLLAQAFWRVNPAFGVRAVSMRGPECTLDLAGQPGDSHVQAAQTLLMETLRGGMNLETRMVEGPALGDYPLRRPPQVSGLVRVVLFRDAQGEIWEASACGGTHLPQGVQAAPVVVLKTERIKNDLTRVTFMAGEEATERLSGVYAQAQALARGFSVGVDRLPERVADLQAELKVAQELTRTLQQALAAQLLDRADWRPLGDGRATLIDTEDEELLPALLEAAVRRPDSLTVVLGAKGRCGVASSLPQHPAQTRLRDWLTAAGGRGGGRPELAQGQTTGRAEFRRLVHDWLAQAATTTAQDATRT